MALIQFTANFDDLSTDRGFQFRFRCDKCHNGYQSTFQPFTAGIVSDVLRSAGNIFGGVLGSAGHGAYEIQRAIASIGPVKATGFIGWLIWLFVPLAFLTGFKNRVAVVFNWLIAFLGSSRPQRAITPRQLRRQFPK